MKTDVGDLWTYPADHRVITTNGIVKKNGKLVMGKGIALVAKQKYKGIDKFLGNLVTEYGNHVYSYYDLISFPTKNNWRNNSDIKLIEQSIKELILLIDSFINKNKVVVLPPVGCGNGGLDFETQVRPLLEKYLDDRFVVLI